ncbi:MAG: L,D-transpeptidase [Endomicrobia bacterium]|nr:L,D-transpeptidase [Endomicrobiia bacterium]
MFVLEGLQLGVNKGGNVDSEKRKIYIHGTPEEGLIGRPASHGCIRMKNLDIVELFDLVPVGTLVEIKE